MFSTDLDTAFQQAMLAFQAGQWQEAESALTALSQRWPDCKEVWYQRAELCQRQERLSEALDCYGRVLELDPRVQEVYLQLGRIAATQAQPELALGYWRQALTINPAYHDARLNLALLLAQLGEAAQSQAEFAEVIRRTPELVPELCHTAREHLQRGQALETLSLCGALAEAAPDPRLALWAAWACQLCGDEAGAQHYLATLPSSWGPAVAALYVPAQLDPADRPLWRERVAAGLQTPATLPLEIVGELPRWPAWQDLGLQPDIDAWLQAACGLPAGTLTRPAAGRSLQRLLWVVDADVVPWLPWYAAQLNALPRGRWEIWLALRSPRLAPLLPLERRYQLLNLAPEWPEACAQIQAAQPDVLLLSHPQRDSLQFALQSQAALAPVQGAWPAWQAAESLPETPGGDWPLWPLTPALSPAQGDAAAFVLFPISAQGWTPGDVTQILQVLATGPVCLCAELTRLPQLQTLQQQLVAQAAPLAERLELRLWLSLPELDRLLAQARGLLLPERGAAPYVLAAQRLGLPCLSEAPSDPEWSHADAEPWLRWDHTLPATAWPVQLQHLLTQAHREEPHA